MADEKKAPRRPMSKKEYTAYLMRLMNKWVDEGLTPLEAVNKLTEKQFDHLVDQGIDTDNWILTPDQLKNIAEVKRAERTVKPGGYNKKYPKSKQELYNAIREFVREMGADIQPREKENFRDLDFTLEGTEYKIVLSNPRPKK